MHQLISPLPSPQMLAEPKQLSLQIPIIQDWTGSSSAGTESRAGKLLAGSGWQVVMYYALWACLTWSAMPGIDKKQTKQNL